MLEITVIEHPNNADRAPFRRLTHLMTRLFWALLFVALIIASIELGIGLFYAWRDSSWKGALERLTDEGNKFVADVNSHSGCRYVDILIPHPYLAVVHRDNPQCRNSPSVSKEVAGFKINNVGFFGRDFPFERSSDNFQILLTGGSVAAHLGQIFDGGPLFLEEELNRCYRPPHGGHFLVFNGAAGAWKQPQQAIMVMLYGNAFDGIVTLEGFNEHYRFLSPIWARVGLPDSNFFSVSPVAAQSYRYIAATWIAKEIIASIPTWPILRHSFIIYGSADATKRYLAELADKDVRSDNIINSYFLLPQNWTDEHRRSYNMELYRGLLRSIASIASQNSAKSAFFIQPVPAIGKRLTELEGTIVGDLSYRDPYLALANGLMKLADEKIAIFNLLDIFSNVEQTLYSDPIHLAKEVGFESLGNRILAREMASRLAGAWGLQRTCGN